MSLLKVNGLNFGACELAWLENKARLFSKDTAAKSPAPAVRMAYLAGRLCAAHLLNPYDQTLKIISEQKYGYLKVQTSLGEPTPFHLSISHSDNFAVAAVSHAPVGIDLERKSREISRSLLDRIASFQEIQNVISATQAEYAPILHWSLKEAISKAVGLGYRHGFRVFEIEFSKTTPPWPVKVLVPTPISFSKLEVTFLNWEGFIVAICAEEIPEQIEFQIIEPKILKSE